MDGSGAETLLSDVGVVGGLAVDPLAYKLYFSAQYFTAGSLTGEIVRTNRDGSNPETILSILADGVDVDPFGGKLYLVTEAGIQRSDLDGAELETIVGHDDVTSLEPGGIAVDPAKGKLYWANSSISAPRIMRADLDGSNVVTLVTGADVAGSFYPLRIALDRRAGQMFWTDDHAIRRASIDGSNIQVVMEWDPQSFGGPVGIQIDVPGNAVPATSVWAVVLLALLLTGTATAVLLRRRSRTPCFEPTYQSKARATM